MLYSHLQDSFDKNIRLKRMNNLYISSNVTLRFYSTAGFLIHQLIFVYRTETCSDRVHFYLKSLFRVKVTMPDGGNVRKAIVAVMTELQRKLLETAEDDIKSLSAIAFVSVMLWLGRGG